MPEQTRQPVPEATAPSEDGTPLPCTAVLLPLDFLALQLWFLWQLGETCNCGFLKSKLGAEV